MAARVEEQRDDQPATARTAPQQQDDGGSKEVSLTAFRVMFPGIVSGGIAGGG